MDRAKNVLVRHWMAKRTVVIGVQAWLAFLICPIPTTILEMLATTDFDSGLKAIAQKLGIMTNICEDKKGAHCRALRLVMWKVPWFAAARQLRSNLQMQCSVMWSQFTLPLGPLGYTIHGSRILSVALPRYDDERLADGDMPGFL
ncbi:hypothetical protein BDW75DRAFT_177887 [Aspergillus navahoensis]